MKASDLHRCGRYRRHSATRRNRRTYWLATAGVARCVSIDSFASAAAKSLCRQHATLARRRNGERT